MVNKSFINKLNLDIDKNEHLFPWHKKSIKDLLFILYKYFKNPKQLDILDVGCSVDIMKYLSNHVNSITGINISFDEKDIIENSKYPNCKLIEMDATNLKFEDASFDFAFSTNVLEHVLDVPKALKELQRIIKPNGYLYSSFYPIWSGPRGHHVHDDDTMMKYWIKQHGEPKLEYKNNGEFIPDWYHLIYTENEMYDHLNNKFENPELTSTVVNYMYKKNHLNRLFFEEYKKIFNKVQMYKVFMHTQIIKFIPTDIYEILRSKYKFRDYQVIGCEILFKKVSFAKLYMLNGLTKPIEFMYESARKIWHKLKRIR